MGAALRGHAGEEDLQHWLTDWMVSTRDQVTPSFKRAAGRSHAHSGVRLRQVYSNVWQENITDVQII